MTHRDPISQTTAPWRTDPTEAGWYEVDRESGMVRKFDGDPRTATADAICPACGMEASLECLWADCPGWME